MKASHQGNSPARLSASKYKSGSKEQEIKDEAIAKRNDCMGLRVSAVEDEDFNLMMETLDKGHWS